MFCDLLCDLYSLIFSIPNPLTPRSDQHMNSPYKFNTLSSRQVVRIKKIIN